ncbi:hypothetical protein CKM354_001204700 [Cercospora kikuchii]|uniref:L-ornithine N(5)-monooxygenase [NAD(P)H] n=1 Tax=Cercospora kikuchii TaxID=84275 RepID=A0A9P3FIV9_9PEZI|nr:uncharacterized protein CKM354_001204700 [Cercospora kikuchii]GIZ49006.1 hypothetical protein CKM354_001204700 [Cercospora kikuchii]
MPGSEYDSLVACIGSGFSGICVGAQLKRWYNETDIVFFDRQESAGGTWWINTYPGIACDVPAPLYSLSFEQSATWSSLFPPGREIKEYLDRVAAKYDLRSKMRFASDVQSCIWDAERQHWTLSIKDLYTGETYSHTSRILFASCGQLLRPNDLDVPGSETFAGPIFHSARWRKDVDCTRKRVIVIGNGCTAAQIVPNLLKDSPPQSLTQIVRSKHWILAPPDVQYTSTLRAILAYVPGALWMLRLLIFLAAELSFPFFYTNRLAAWYRNRATVRAKAYMRSQCPPELHDALIPNFKLGCKRRIFDPGYLKSLHDPRVRVETRAATRVIPEGIRMSDGAVLEADVIVLANGFRTNYFLDQLNIVGENGKTVQEHWSQFGGAEAYNCSALSGFPNFFVILGPNAATGHTSAIMACENSVNYALRVLKPILSGRRKIVSLKSDAERSYVEAMQSALAKRVWNTGCQSWYVQDNNWNAMSYPWTQAHYWFRSVFPVWRDWSLQ